MRVVRGPGRDAVVTDDDGLAARIRILREKGTDKHSFITENRTRGFYEYIDTGNSYVQSNILGALGASQLRKIDMMNARRREIARFYTEKLSGISEIKLIRITEGSETNWHIYGILVNEDDKYWIMDALRAEGVMANIHYSPLHRNRLYSHLATDGEMEGSMTFFSRFLRLPLYPSLSDSETEAVVSSIYKIFGA